MRVILCAVGGVILATSTAAARGDVLGAEPNSVAAPALGTPRRAPLDFRFRGTFETGSAAPWPSVQCANAGFPSSTSIVRGTIAVVSGFVGEGRYGARFDLPAANTRQACEVLVGRPIGLGTDDYYALMVRFPRKWREPSPTRWGLAIAQLNYQGIWGAPVALIAHADRVALVLQSGLCRSGRTNDPGCTYSSGRGGNLGRTYAVRAPMALAAWHEVVVHVRWATDSSGVLEAWHRVKGRRTWKKTVSLLGYPTVQWTTDLPPERIAVSQPVDKIGAYRGGDDVPLTIWHDGFVRATSFDSATSVLP